MKRILVVQTGKLGDMVCTTPVFRAIKEKYRDAHLYVAGDKVNKEMLQGNPHVFDYVLTSELGREKIKQLHLDAAILLTPNPRILFYLLWSRVPQVIVPKIVGGFSPYATKKYRLLSLFATRVEHRMGHYAPQEYLNMLIPLHIISTDTKKELFFSNEGKEKIRHIVSQHEHSLRIVISPSAGNKIKNWGGKNFAHVTDYLFQTHNAAIFIIGSARDKEEVEEMISYLSPDTRIIDLSGRLSLDELKAFISTADLFISVDTGPVYIAEACGVPTIDIIGPMDEREQPPLGEKHKVVYIKDRKEPILHIMNARVYDIKQAREQIEKITPEMVIKEIESLMPLL